MFLSRILTTQKQEIVEIKRSPGKRLTTPLKTRLRLKNTCRTTCVSHKKLTVLRTNMTHHTNDELYVGMAIRAAEKTRYARGNVRRQVIGCSARFFGQCLISEQSSTTPASTLQPLQLHIMGRGTRRPKSHGRGATKRVPSHENESVISKEQQQKTMTNLQLCKDAIERRTSTARHGEHDPLIPPGERHPSGNVVRAAEGPGLVLAATTDAVLVWGTLLLLLGGARALSQASRIVTGADDVGAGLCCRGVRRGRPGGGEPRRRCRHCLCVGDWAKRGLVVLRICKHRRLLRLGGLGNARLQG